MPFSRWIGHVGYLIADRSLYSSDTFQIHPKLQIPVNAVILSAFITILLAAVYIGSSDAYNAIVCHSGCL